MVQSHKSGWAFRVRPDSGLFCYAAVAHISTSSVNLAFEPKSGLGWVQASKWGPFTTLCGYVGRGQQGEIGRIHPLLANNKNRLKSFCEVGYANFRSNVFSAGKRISMEILVGVGLHAWCPAALKRFCSFFKKTEMCKKTICRLCKVKWLEQDIKSRCDTHKMHEN